MMFIEESERSLHDANVMARRALKNSTVVTGGGAVDMGISRYLRQNACTVGRSQLFINSYAKALEVPGGNMRYSFPVNGPAFKKTFSTFSYAGFAQQPKKFLNPKILLLNIELKLKSEKKNAEIRLSDPSQYQSIVDAERNIIYEKLDKCVSSGAKIILSRLAIGDLATQYFADRDVFCAGRITEEDLNRVATATGGTIQTTVKNVIDEDLGSCEMYEERQVGNERFYIFSGCPLSRTTSAVVIRGGAKQRKGSCEPLKRLNFLKALIQNGKIYEMMKHYDLEVVPCETLPDNKAILEVSRYWKPSVDKAKLVVERTEQLGKQLRKKQRLNVVYGAIIGFGIVNQCSKLYSATKRFIQDGGPRVEMVDRFIGSEEQKKIAEQRKILEKVNLAMM